MKNLIIVIALFFNGVLIGQNLMLFDQLRQAQINNATVEELKAFPTAEGFGKNSDAGRGGTVIKVTNLNNDGAGSLRDAVQWTSGNRTIVFEVGGTITLTTDIDVTNSNVRIAGQTAPGGGILIKGGMFTINTSNVIIQHIRFRLDPVALPNKDCLAISAFGGQILENIIIDHCSFSWGGDENVNFRGITTGITRNVTMQYCIISEGLYGVLMDGTLGNTGHVANITFYKNLFIHNSQRNVTSNSPVDSVFGWEMINNIVYGVEGATGTVFGTKFTVLNNHYRDSSEETMYPIIIDVGTTNQGTPSETYAYLSGNIIPAGTDEFANSAEIYLEPTPFLISGISAIPAIDIANDILSHVGASLPNRDTVDVRLINQYNAGTGAAATSGTYPTIGNGTPATDTDNDGMADTWETSNFGDLSRDGTGDFDGDGYTDLEEFLNGTPPSGIVLNVPELDMLPYNERYCEVYTPLGQEIFKGDVTDFQPKKYIHYFIKTSDKITQRIYID